MECSCDLSDIGERVVCVGSAGRDPSVTSASDVMTFMRIKPVPDYRAYCRLHYDRNAACNTIILQAAYDRSAGCDSRRILLDVFKKKYVQVKANDAQVKANDAVHPGVDAVNRTMLSNGTCHTRA
jgi:hypothetical protein